MKKLLAAITLLMALGLNAQAIANEGHPRVSVLTSMGEIVIELNSTKAPKTVENFLRYVKEGFYEGTIFHRVIDDFMVQGGGYNKALRKRTPHPPIMNEADNGLSNKIGTVAMARTMDPHSAAAQFYINVANNTFLDFREKTPRGWGYTVFGRVVKGMDVVAKIKSVPTTNPGHLMRDVPADPIVIEKVTLLNQAPEASKE